MFWHILFFPSILSLHHIYTVRMIPWCCISFTITTKQYSYQREYCLSFVVNITLLITMWYNHCVFVITFKIFMCSTFQLVILQFDQSNQYLYIFHTIYFWNVFLCPWKKIINKPVDIPIKIAVVVSQTKWFVTIKGNRWE